MTGARQNCNWHNRYTPGCDDCRAARRIYIAEQREARGLPEATTRKPQARYRTTPAPGPWADRAECKDTDPTLFYLGERDGRHFHFTTALALCAACPVRAECLDHAIAAKEEYGIWGGLQPDERDDEKRLRGNATRRMQRHAARTTNQPGEPGE